MRARYLFKWGVLLLGLVGCRNSASVPSPVDAATIQPGHFLIVLQGMVADTLTGRARFRTDPSDMLVVDLIGFPDTSQGLSLELPLSATDTLEAVRRWVTRPASGTFMVGYLSWPPYTFVTEAGELVLEARTRVDQMAGTFRLALGAFDRHTDELLEVEAIGAFVATSASEK